MGVDLDTYRGRIGTFRHSQGLAVVTVVCVVNFSKGLKAAGAVVFIGVLLLIAGIESNPGPTILDLCTCSSPKTKIKVTGLPGNIDLDEEDLQNIFENKHRQGGGYVKQVEIFKDQRNAVIEFEESEAVEIVLEKKPITVKKTEVNVHLFHSSDTVEVTGIPTEVSVKILKDYFNKQTSDESSVTCIVMEDDIAFVTFKNEQITKQIVFKDRHTLDNCQQPIVVKFHDPVLHRLRTDTISAIGSSDPDSENTISQNQGLGFQTHSEKELAFKKLLERIGLLSRIDKKITRTEVLTVGVSPTDKTKVNVTDYPWILLQKICTGHCNARDMNFALSTTYPCRQLSDTLSPLRNLDFGSEKRISPLDLFLAVYHCCDQMLKQLIFKNLYLCKLAVPFLTDQFCISDSTPLLSIWPLRTLTLESNISRDDTDLGCTEFDALDLPSTFVTFARFGRPSFSKSKLLNRLLHDETNITFFNFECSYGTEKRTISDGYVEMFWLPTTNDNRDMFSSPLTFLNVRGDLRLPFCKTASPFLSNITDILSVIIDIRYLLKNCDEVNNVITNFRNVILIISGSWDPKDDYIVNGIKDFNVIVRKEKPSLKVHVLLTHEGRRELNILEMVSRLSTLIESFLNDTERRTLEMRLSRLQNDSVISDEEEKTCVEGKRLATEVIRDILRINTSPQNWKKTITPAQYFYSKRLGDAIKRTHREQNIKVNDTLKQEIHALRNQQMQNVTSTVRLFAAHLVSLAKSHSFLSFFLAWLKIFIEKEKCKIMPILIQENRTAWEKLGILKSMRSPNLEDIESHKERINKTEKQIQEASFNTDLLFREIGHLYETIILLNKDSETLGLPTEEDIIHVCASLFIEGNSLELIDGEGFYMPEQWIRRVFNEVSDIIGTQKVFTLSVLGLQSSGKSTLLNTMFGSQFPTSSGVCTKGIQMHLLPLQRNHRFKFMLILDTEGLRSPELSDGKYDIDNQLATIITGIGDTTVLNIMGENSSVVRDILQVVVHAFLRLKLADSNIDIRKSCSFIHHNVTSVTAQDKMRPAIFHLMNTLDSVTKEAAEMEGISDISEINQIIHTDMSSQVWFLPNLWQGFTPMTRINSEYSGQVADIKCKLIEQATSDTKKAYGSLNGVISQTRDLWKGVLTDDFVFCFRNSLEIRAYNVLENKLLHWSSEMQSFLQEKCVETSQKEFAKCWNQKCLDDVAITVNTILLDLLSGKKNDIAQEMEAFFDENDYGEIVKQWKGITKQRFNIICNEMHISCKKEIERFRAKKSFEIFQTTNRSEHEDKLHKKSMKLAKSLHDRSIHHDEIDRQFEMIWDEFIKEIRGKDQFPMVYFFRQRLYELFKDDQSFRELIKQKFDKYVNFNSDLISLPYINLDDIYKLVNVAKDDPYVNYALKKIECLIHAYCSRSDSVIYDHVVSFLQEVQEQFDCIGKNRNLPWEQTLIIEVLVHVSCYAARQFDQHNLDPKTQHSVKIPLKDTVCSYLDQLFSSEKQILGQEMNKESVVVKSLKFNSIKLSSSDISIPQSILKTTKFSDADILCLVRKLVNKILAQADAEVNEICKQDTEISESNIKTVLYNVKRAVEDLKAHKSVLTVTPRFAIRVCLYVSEYMSFRFQQHNKEYLEGIENRLNTYKESVRARFDAHLADRKTEDTAALLLSREMYSVVCDVVKSYMPGKIKQELMNIIPSPKNNLIIAMMSDLAEQEIFMLFISYIENASWYAETWIKDKSEKYLFYVNQPVYFHIASRKISEIFEDLYNGIDETTTHFKSSSPQLEEWVDKLNESLNHCQIPDKIIRDAKREITSIPDVVNFKAIILKKLKLSEEKLMLETKQETKDTVRWELSDPYKEVFEFLWGCTEQCAYCGEPCFKNKSHEDYNLKHQCLQHRPLCCSGIRNVNGCTAGVETCNYSVQNRNKRHNCIAFNFACNPLKDLSCKDKMHYYIDYRSHLHNWDIEPSTEMTDSSKFWLWFVFKYKEKLAEYYDYDISNIPLSWQHITKKSAIESVRQKYSIV